MAAVGDISMVSDSLLSVNGAGICMTSFTEGVYRGSRLSLPCKLAECSDMFTSPTYRCIKLSSDASSSLFFPFFLLISKVK